jgi:hypothetical protein
MSQEQLLREIRRYAQANNLDLNAVDLNTRWFNWLKAESETRRLNPGLGYDTPSAAASVNKSETARQTALLMRMRKIATEQNLSLTKALDFLEAERLAKQQLSEKKQGPITFRVHLTKQPAPVQFSYENLIAEYLAERGLQDVPENREAARRFFIGLAERRGMTRMDPALLAMNDSVYQTYRSLVGF